MKNYLIPAFFSVLLLAACSNEKAKTTATETADTGLLSTDLVNNPRTASGNNEAAMAAMPTMDFQDTVFDFGAIKQGDVVTHEFTFTNNGKNPLIISSAKGSCGCTVPQYPDEPIPPGKSGIMKVQFNSAGKEGHQEKSISITANSKRGFHLLFIKGDVNK
jgi:hypothetical protein